MQFASAALSVVAETGGHESVALETLPYGIVALAVFAVAGMVVASYRHVANRHADPAEHADQSH
ncbi:hypothetical protein [Microbacterium excoecariae]|uniref:hypothetical protein n=1 Tax=Microbacterium excoecariae TaxID=2715210 RepID=UPI00140D4865|nr:hypothetical protein [Microbacterium excoecariae]NHI16981.1 hypothetical protein [Microbacterium excoecariae]